MYPILKQVHKFVQYSHDFCGICDKFDDDDDVEGEVYQKQVKDLMDELGGTKSFFIELLIGMKSHGSLYLDGLVSSLR